MNRRTLNRRFASSNKPATSAAKKLAQWRPQLEPLEDRVLLSAVNWNITQAQSSVTLALPD
jgi:hypothetical protein